MANVFKRRLRKPEANTNIWTHQADLSDQESCIRIGEEASRQVKVTAVYRGLNRDRMLIIFVIDTSSSMASNNAILHVNRGMINFTEYLKHDERAMDTVEVAVVEFNDTASVRVQFTPLKDFVPPELSAGGMTAGGAGINLAIDILKERLRWHDSKGTPVYRPWVVYMSDGGANDDLTLARARIKEEESKGKYGKLKFWAWGTPTANMEQLLSLSKGAVRLQDCNFETMFDWTADSMARISVSKVGEQVKLSDMPHNADYVYSKSIPDCHQ